MNTMTAMSIVLDNIVTNFFHSLWIVAWIFYINHSTGIYSNIAELSRDVYVCNKMLDAHINTKETETRNEANIDYDDRLKTLEEDIEHMTKKLSKVKKMYIALSENVAKLNDRLIDIEDEVYNEEEEDEEEESSSSESNR